MGKVRHSPAAPCPAIDGDPDRQQEEPHSKAPRKEKKQDVVCKTTRKKKRDTHVNTAEEKEQDDRGSTTREGMKFDAHSSSFKMKKPEDNSKASKEKKKHWREMKVVRRLERQRQLREVHADEPPAVAAAPLPFPAAPDAGHGVPYTVAVAVPGSIMDNAQSAELRALLAGQVARAAAVFCVDEVVVFNDQGAAALQRSGAGQPPQPPDCCQQLGRLLQYMECPQYLRKQLFPFSAELRCAGLLSPLDCPHHLRRNEHSPFREGVVTNQPPVGGRYSMVNIGLQREVRCDRLLTAGVRVTLRMDASGRRGEVVPPRTPRAEVGTYWGYSVRQALSLSEVFTQSVHLGGYDLLLGTSDKGRPVSEVAAGGLPPFRHLLVAFGGLQGLEVALENDDRLTLDSPAELFDVYVNSCPGQGCRTIRTEEALFITLAALQPTVSSAGRAGLPSPAGQDLALDS